MINNDIRCWFYEDVDDDNHNEVIAVEGAKWPKPLNRWGHESQDGKGPLEDFKSCSFCCL